MQTGPQHRYLNLNVPPLALQYVHIDLSLSTSTELSKLQRARSRYLWNSNHCIIWTLHVVHSMLDLDIKLLNWSQSLKNFTLTELSKSSNFATKSRGPYQGVPISLLKNFASKRNLAKQKQFHFVLLQYCETTKKCFALFRFVSFASFC